MGVKMNWDLKELRLKEIHYLATSNDLDDIEALSEIRLIIKNSVLYENLDLTYLLELKHE